MKQLVSILKRSYKIGYKQSEEDYDEATEDGALAFRRLAELYFLGLITLNEFVDRFQVGVEEHYVRIMLVALHGTRDPNDDDLRILQGHIDNALDYFDEFVSDIRAGRVSEQRGIWRAGLYGFPRAAYINFTIPVDVAELMPVLPGDDCLGGSLCKCSLNVETDANGTHYVYWVLDPTAESCPVCIAHAIESPFVFTAGDM